MSLLNENDKDAMLEHLQLSCESAAENLLQESIATLVLPENLHSIPAKAFQLFRQHVSSQYLLDKSQNDGVVPVLLETSNAANATGYHDYGGLSPRYNQYRRGFVFSNGEICPGLDASFCQASHELFDLLHTIFDIISQALERRLELPSGWFQTQLGPTVSHSQWHLKEYDNAVIKDANQHNQLLWLGKHTDPSLISVVIHDRPGIQMDGYGLQYTARKDKTSNQTTWKNVTHTGHGVAVIFVGSVLATLSQGHLPACTHRVVAASSSSSSSSDTNHATRMAATLFARPAPQARLVTPPCWSDNKEHKVPLTFQEWNARVSRNYGKSKRK